MDFFLSVYERPSFPDVLVSSDTEEERRKLRTILQNKIFTVKFSLNIKKEHKNLEENPSPRKQKPT